MEHSRILQVKRILDVLFPYVTFEKLVNLSISLLEKYLRIYNLKSYPLVLKIEPTPLCQLSCNGCSHKDSAFKERVKLDNNLTKENLAQIIDPLKKKLFWISLSHRGEPFLNKNLLELVEYIHNSNIAVSFPTNFSFKFNETKINRIANSGLDKLFISLDGASQKTYGNYRNGGNFELILSNVKKLSIYKKKNGLSRPIVVWKFIIFEHNKHEINIVKEKYKSLGFDSYQFVHNRSGIIARDNSLKQRSKRMKKRKNCFWLWHAMVIFSNGQINPCCNRKNYNIGNAYESSSINAWNNNVYQNLRMGFKKENFPKKIHPFCQRDCFK